MYKKLTKVARRSRGRSHETNARRPRRTGGGDLVFGPLEVGGGAGVDGEALGVQHGVVRRAAVDGSAPRAYKYDT